MKKSVISLAVITATMLNPTAAFAGDKAAQVASNASVKTAKMITPTLASILKVQPDETQARYEARNPQQTLEFFGIKPGMTVVEALPGGGWYSKLLLPYLAESGHLIGADYALEMYPKFGFFSQQRLDEKKTWVADWTQQASSWREQKSAQVSAFQLGSMPQAMKGQADAALFVRALHNLARFESDGGYLTQALKDTFEALKPGGTVGIVQHMAPESATDEWANGSKGYLKKSFIIEKMKQAGFEYVASSDINLNPKDQPAGEDIVWRLPPSLATSSENPELQKQYLAIGESNRMTLSFRKPI